MGRNRVARRRRCLIALIPSIQSASELVTLDGWLAGQIKMQSPRCLTSDVRLLCSGLLLLLFGIIFRQFARKPQLTYIINEPTKFAARRRRPTARKVLSQVK